MVVQPDFTYTHNPRILRQLADLQGVMFREMPCIVRVNAHRGVNPIVALGQGDGSLEVIRSGTAPNGQKIAQSGSAGALDHRVAVGVEVGIIEMAM
jgi:hypothetical protein